MRARPTATPRSVVVTGASSGLGTALALALAAPGTHLGLVARDAARLDAVAGRCEAVGAEVDTIACDIREAAPLARWLTDLDRRHPVDLLIVNAGIAGGAEAPDRPEGDETAQAVFATNVGGALNALHPLLPAMVSRARGRIILVSSLAAYAPLPDYPAYSGSKAALLAYGLALREALRPRGVSVCVACPGFVATPMGEAYRGWRPLEMSAEAAARRILTGEAQDRPVTAFPRRLAVAARLGAAVPEGVRHRAMALLGFTAPRRA